MSITTPVVSLPVTLSAPSGSAAPSGSVSAPVKRKLVPVGSAYAAHARRAALRRSFEDDDKAVEEARRKAAEAAAAGQEQDDGVGEEPESRALLASDPKEWKKLDMYAVLGLSSLRYKATPDQIRRAHRKKVLRHHPDKKAGSSGNTSDDSFFKCVAKAFEILDNPEKRRQFDSYDPEVDDDIPEPKAKVDFFALYGPVFEREARFHKGDPSEAPKLGSMDSSRAEVDEFYNFWYNFDSWRSFEWYDKEVNEGSDSRDDKRYTEKKNKSERERRKKEDNARRRQLVDQTLSLDPRIKKFKAEEKAAREAKRAAAGKGGKPGAPKVDPKEEELKKKEAAEAAAAAAKKAEEEKAAKATDKKAKEAARKNLKKSQKAVRAAVTAANYFQPAGTSPSVQVVEGQLTELDLLLDALEPEEVAALKKDVDAAADDAARKDKIVEAAKKVVAAGKADQARFAQFA